VRLRIFSIMAACGLVTAAASAVEAGDFLADGAFTARFKEGWGELSSGMDAGENSWSQHATAVVGLDGPLHGDGWRLKLQGTYGQYRYDARNPHVCKQIHDATAGTPNRTLSGICEDLASGDVTEERRTVIDNYLASYGMEAVGHEVHAFLPFGANHYRLGAAPGYQATMGRLIVRAYLGVAFEQHDVLPVDPENALAGAHWGAQGWMDAWLPLGDAAWLSADGGYFAGTASHSANMKLGLRPVDWLTVGPEVATHGDSEDVTGRAGGFVRFDSGGWETTLAGGISGTYRGEPGAYGSANMFIRF
jgi:hypothetical protein